MGVPISGGYLPTLTDHSGKLLELSWMKEGEIKIPKFEQEKVKKEIVTILKPVFRLKK